MEQYCMLCFNRDMLHAPEHERHPSLCKQHSTCYAANGISILIAHTLITSVIGLRFDKR